MCVLKNLNRINPRFLNQDLFVDRREYKILTGGSERDSQIISKAKTSSVLLEEVYEVRDGISTGFKPFPEILLGKRQGQYFVSLNGNKEAFDAEVHKKVIDGGEFNKFTKIYWEGRYIKYDKKIEYNPKPKQDHPFNCQLREKEIFEQKVKILSRQTSNRLIMTLDQNRYYTRNSVHNIYPKDGGKDLNIKYVLAVLNSSLLDYIYIKSTQEIGKVHPQVHISDLRKLPIKKVSMDEQQPIIGLVDRILAITEDEQYLENPIKQNKVKEFMCQIDQIVYKLYGLTKEEIKIVESFNKD